LTDPSFASIFLASASIGGDGGGCSCAYQQIVKNMQKFFFISIHKPPPSIRFAPIKHALAVTVEPFKFSPAEPVAYELSYMKRSNSSASKALSIFRDYTWEKWPLIN
jgi:hypothetical protein